MSDETNINHPENHLGSFNKDLTTSLEKERAKQKRSREKHNSVHYPEVEDNLPALTPNDLSRMWVKDGITESQSDNGLNAYEAYLGFDRSELDGKDILEIGIGRTARLQQDIKAAGIEATVIGISPDLIKSSHRQNVNKHAIEDNNKNVAAIAEVLPFTDESFDEVFALYSLTYYTYDRDQTKAWVSELGRVLRPNGNARLGPDYGDNNAFGDIGNELLGRYAEAAGMVLSEEHGSGPGTEYLLLHKLR